MTTKINGALAPTTIADALNKTLETPSLDPILLSIANEFLGGNSITEIAEKFEISSDRVTQIVEKKEVKSYIDNVYLTQGYLNRIKRINIINNVKKIHSAGLSLILPGDILNYKRNTYNFRDFFYLFLQVIEPHYVH